MNQDDKLKTKITEARHAELTQIGSTFQSQDTSQGFVKAKEQADKALAENKLILNSRFVLKSTLGAGGMGTVYMAEDLRKVEARDTNTCVAVKILNTDFKNHPDAYISLQREASRSHLLSHPNIVTVHDFDRDGDTIFMTMELLEGEDLELLLSRYKNTGLKKDKALRILKDYCVALEFAHKKGIIHSDFKPGNIFVTKEEGTKVLDFGIARLALDSKKEDHFDAGRIGAITPAYASLEMIGRKPPDASDDVYAAAIIAYELLTGKHPYQKQSAATALAKQMTPDRPAGISKRQWKALLGALQLKRQDRTKTIKEFLDGMTLTPAIHIYRTISIALLAVISWFVYSLFFAPNELSRVIEDTLVKANQCFAVENYQCTIESANAILEISPQHQQANELLHQAQINQQLEDINRCFTAPEAVECAIQHLENLLGLAPNHANLAEINKRIENERVSIKVTALFNRAMDCRNVNNYQCAIDNANKVLRLRADHKLASLLLQQSQQAYDKRQLELEQINNDYQKLMNIARSCYQQSKYDCSIKNAKQALELKPNDDEADKLYQSSNYARQQQQDNLRKADKVLKDGQKCLAKLDYSCAIAKSESALEFVPNYKKALQLKRDATESLKRVKKKIEIE